jgi:ABC-type multidrug transport system fused ATPase/permease subunit
MQTVVCDLEDKPVSLDSWLNGSGAFPDMYPDAKINSLYEGLVGTIGSHFEVDTLCKSIDGLLNITNVLLGPLPKDNVSSFFTAPNQFETFLEDQYGVSPQVAKDLMQASLNVSAAGALLSTLGSGPGLYPNLSPDVLGELVCNTSFLFTVITLPGNESGALQQSLCSPRNGTVDLSPLADELSQELDYSKILQLENPFSVSNPVQLASDLYFLLTQISHLQKMIADFSTLTEEGGVNNTDMYGPLSKLMCGPNVNISTFVKFGAGLITRDSHLDSSLHRDAKGQKVIVLHRREFRPKIFYTPNNTVTARIIKRANRTFSIVDDILAAVDRAKKCQQKLYDGLPEYSSRTARLNNYMKWLVDGQGDPLAGGFSSIILSSIRSSLLANMTEERKNFLRGLFNDTAPNNLWSLLRQLRHSLDDVRDNIELVDWDFFHPVENEQELEEWAANYDRVRAANFSYILAGFVFQNALEGSTDLTIKIRMNTTYVHETDIIRNKVWYQDPERNLWKRRYFDAGFIFLQDMVERAAMEVLAGKNITSPGVYIQEMPYPCYKKDRFVLSIQLMLPVITTVAWLFTVAMTVRGVVREKELRLKEVMKMMGLGRLVHWLAWFITSAVILSISVVGITVVLFAFGILVHANVFLVWAFLELYALVIILFCFLMSLFFNNANLSASLSGLLYFMTIFLSITVWLKQGQASLLTLAIPSLIAPVAFSIGIGYIGQFELQQVGLHFANLGSSSIQEDHFSFLLASAMLVLDALVYSVLIWYIDAAFPGKYGTAKPWYFPFQPSFWLGKSRVKCIKEYFTRKRSPLSVQADDEEDGLLHPLDSDSEEELLSDRSDNFEQSSSNLPVGIQIENLVKIYSGCRCSGRGWGCGGCGRRCGGHDGGVLAVNNLSLSLYEDQITAFLGHNGAGKTTTMAILTGLFEPTSGTAFINGMDIKKSMDSIRKNLGICPQHNVLFDRWVCPKVCSGCVTVGVSWGVSREMSRDVCRGTYVHGCV